MTTAVPIDVLHVDDDPSFADLAATFLERVAPRIAVRSATGVDAAQARLDEHDIDCIVSDYEMPGTNGIEFLESIRERYPDLPFILCTGKGSEEIASEAISAGVTDYLQKGTGTEQYELLANRIINAVDAHHSTQLLSERTRRLETLIETLPGIVYRCRNEPTWPMETVEGEVESVVGYTAAELERNEVKWGAEIILPEDREPMWMAVQDGLAEDGSFEVTYRVRTKDGAVRWMWERGRGIYDDADELVALEGFITDVTEPKTHEARLERTTTRLGVLFENSPDMIDIHTGDGTIIDVNKRFCEVLDHSREELIGEKVWDVHLDTDPERLREVWAEMDVGDRSEVRTSFVRSDGERFPAKVHLTRIPGDGSDGRFLVFSRDISSQVDRERTLRRYEQMVNTMQEPSCIYDNAGRFLLANEALADVYDQPPSKLEGQSSRLLEEVRAAADGDPFSELVDGDREEFNGHIELSFPTTGRVAIEYRMTPIVVDGTTKGVVAVSREITDRLDRERELKRIRDHLDRTEDIADVGGWELNPDTEDVFWTENLYDLFGVPGDFDPDFASALDVYVESDREVIQNAVERALSTGDPFDVEAQFCRNDEQRWLRVQGVPTVEDGEIETLRGAVQDITDQKRRERDLEQARQEADELFNGMNDCTWVVDSEQHFRAVNDAAEERLGYSREELLSMGPHDIDVGLAPERISNLNDGTLSGDEMQVFETVHETKDGEEFPVEINSSPITYEGEQMTLCVARDISDRKQREEQLAEFASVVSHDLRNPLNVAQGRLELATGECDNEHLDEVKRTHERMNELIDDLLALAQSGTRALDREPIDLGHFVERCWRNVATAEATFETALDCTVSADRTRLQQLFENLFRNAVEHGHEEVTVRIGTLDDAAGFYVEDDGPGIPADERDKVFEMGYSTHRSGTGFGLNIVSRVAEEHDWEVSVAASDDGGARFEIHGVDAS